MLCKGVCPAGWTTSCTKDSAPSGGREKMLPWLLRQHAGKKQQQTWCFRDSTLAWNKVPKSLWLHVKGCIVQVIPAPGRRPDNRTWSLQVCRFEEQEILRWLETFSEGWSLFLPVSATLVSVSPSLQHSTFAQDKARGAKLSTGKPRAGDINRKLFLLNLWKSPRCKAQPHAEKWICWHSVCRRICPPRVHTLGSCVLSPHLGRGVLSTKFNGIFLFHVFQWPYALHLGFCWVMLSPLLLLLVLMDWFWPLERYVLC